MQVSVIPADRVIVIDGAALVFDFQVWPGNLHAIQWNGVCGYREFSSGPQQFIDNPAFVQPYIDAYNAEAARIAAEQAALNG
jgi:hypothetical protein